MSFPNVARVLPISYTQNGNAVSVGRGFMGLRGSYFRGLRESDPFSSMGQDVNDTMNNARSMQRSATVAMMLWGGITLASAVAGGAISGKKAGRGRNALGAGVGAGGGLILGYFAAKLYAGV